MVARGFQPLEDMPATVPRPAGRTNHATPVSLALRDELIRRNAETRGQGLGITHIFSGMANVTEG